MRLVPDSWGTRRLREFNDCHRPKGPGGGQFARKGEAGCAAGTRTAPSTDKGSPRERELDADAKTYVRGQLRQIADSLRAKVKLPPLTDREATPTYLKDFLQTFPTHTARGLIADFGVSAWDAADMETQFRFYKTQLARLEGDGAYSDPEPARDEGMRAKTGAQVREDVLRVSGELEAEVEYAKSRHRDAEGDFSRASKHKEALRNDLLSSGLDWGGLPMYFVGDTIKGRGAPSNPEMLEKWLHDPTVSEEVRENRASALAYFEEAGDTLQRLSVVMYKAAADIKAARDAQREGLNKVLFLPESLRMAAPKFAAMSVYGSKTVLKNQQKALDEAAAFFAGMVSHDHGARYPAVMNVQKATGRLSSRAFASAWSTSIGITKYTGQSVLVHELTHHLEYNSAETLQASVDFRDARVKGNTEEVKLAVLRPGQGYGRDEVVRKGSDTAFRTVYAGKTYKGEGGKNEQTAYDFVGVPHSATEVLTMGMQFMREDPAAFARDDPDWFDWTVDVVRHGPKFAMRNIKTHVPKTPPLRVNVGTDRRTAW